MAESVENNRIEEILEKCRIYTLKCGVPQINLALIPSEGKGWENCFILLQIDGHTHVLGVEPLDFQGENAPVRKLYLSLGNIAEIYDKKESNRAIEFIPITEPQCVHSLNNCNEFINTIESYIKKKNK